MAQDTWIWVFGQVGKTMRGQLRDANGPVDLSQFDSIGWRAKRTETSPPYTALVDVTSIDADQTTETVDAVTGARSGKGCFTYITESVGASVPVSTDKAGHLLTFVAMDGATPHYFPVDVNDAESYARLIVRAAP